MFLGFQENTEELKPQIAKLAAEELLLITLKGDLGGPRRTEQNRGSVRRTETGRTGPGGTEEC